jgi:hypothetical protein
MSVDEVLEPWVRHVRGLADEVLTDSAQDEKRVSAAMLRFTAGESAAELIENGLAAVSVREPTALPELLALLDASGRTPAESPWLEAHEAEVPESIRRLLQHCADGWDVAAPTKGG